MLEGRGGTLRASRGELAPSLGEQPLEPGRVEPLGVQAQLVAVLAREHEAGRAVAIRTVGERLAQPRDVHLHGLGGGRGRRLSPQLVDQPGGAQRLVAVQQQQRQQGPLLAACDRNGLAALVEDLEPAEDAEVHFR